MIFNSKCTIYSPESGGQYRRKEVSACMWQESAGINIQKYGPQNASSARVFLPLSAADPKPGDLIIRGVSAPDISGTYTAKQLAQQFSVYKILTADRKDYGSPEMHHWALEVK